MKQVDLLDVIKIWIYSCNIDFFMANLLSFFLILIFFIFYFVLISLEKNRKLKKIFVTTGIAILIIIIFINYIELIRVAHEKTIKKSIELTKEVQNTITIKECKKNIILYNNNILHIGLKNYIYCIEKSKVKQSNEYLQNMLKN